MNNLEPVSCFYDYKYVHTPDGKWLRTVTKFPVYHDTKMYESRCFYGHEYTHGPDGSWLRTKNRHAIYQVSDTEYHTELGIKYIDEDSDHDPRQAKKNKHDPEGRWQLQNAKNENKYNTTCVRCGLISHRSVLCPTYPYSKTQCDICKRFHRTSDHREAGNLENPSW